MLKWESSVNVFTFLYIFFSFNGLLLSFVVASFVVNHKASSTAGVISEIGGELNYAPDKIGARSCEKIYHNDERDWIF